MRIKVETEKYGKELVALASKFRSGNDFLDEFIRSDDALNDALGKTFVWVDEKEYVPMYFALDID